MKDKMNKSMVVLIFITIINGCAVDRKIGNIPTYASLYNLDLKDNILVFDIKLDIPRNALRKKLIYKFIPKLKVNNDIVLLDTLKVYDWNTSGSKYGDEFHYIDTVQVYNKISKLKIFQDSRFKFNLKNETQTVELTSQIIFEGSFE